MPIAPPHPCPTCHALVVGGQGCRPCGLRRRQRIDDRRGTAHSRGYTARWARYSRAWLGKYPWCGQRQDGALYAEHSHCVQAGGKRVAECVDHIRPMRAGGAQYDPANLQSLCLRCNSLKGNH